jgi:hypothetical protein
MTDKTYNGWTNYETWRVNLEIFDDMTASDFDGADDAEVDIYDFSMQLKDYAEEIIFQQVPINQPSTLMEDYARAFLQDVNWYQIAEHMVNDYIAENQDEHV